MSHDLDIINQEILQNIEKILETLGITYNSYSTRIAMPCPIHGSDNHDSLSISISGRSAGIWKCWTKHCETVHGKTMIGLIRGLLGTLKGNSDLGYVKRWLSDILNNEFDDVEKSNLRSYIQIGKIVDEDRTHITNSSITRKFVRSSLEIPGQYFLNRKFSNQILDKYDVGFCRNKGKMMYMRTVVPVYDENHRYCVGCVGRSINEECDKCHLYHNPKMSCPDGKQCSYVFRKWINSSGFHSGDFLYNYWYAKKEIIRTGTVILVEGQADVWKIEEAGYHNSVGMFGSDLGVYQKKLLDNLGITNIILGNDNDEAGLKSKEKIFNMYSRYYNIYDTSLPKKDFGSMEVKEIQEILQPIFNRL